MANQGSVADVTHSLRGMDFPCRKKELVEHAKRNQADREVLDALQNLPEREYQSMADVMQGFGEERRG